MILIRSVIKKPECVESYVGGEKEKKKKFSLYKYQKDLSEIYSFFPPCNINEVRKDMLNVYNIY